MSGARTLAPDRPDVRRASTGAAPRRARASRRRTGSTAAPPPARGGEPTRGPVSHLPECPSNRRAGLASARRYNSRGTRRDAQLLNSKLIRRCWRSFSRSPSACSPAAATMRTATTGRRYRTAVNDRGAHRRRRGRRRRDRGRRQRARRSSTSSRSCAPPRTRRAFPAIRGSAGLSIAGLDPHRERRRRHLLAAAVQQRRLRVRAGRGADLRQQVAEVRMRRQGERAGPGRSTARSTRRSTTRSCSSRRSRSSSATRRPRSSSRTRTPTASRTCSGSSTCRSSRRSSSSRPTAWRASGRRRSTTAGCSRRATSARSSAWSISPATPAETPINAPGAHGNSQLRQRLLRPGLRRRRARTPARSRRRSEIKQASGRFA